MGALFGPMFRQAARLLGCAFPQQMLLMWHKRPVMKSAVRKIEGNWDLGYVLDKHVLSSIYTGDNAQGYPHLIL